MTTNIIHKKSAVSGKTPLVGQLAYGELALNTYDGVIYLKRNQGVSDEMVTIKQVTEDNLEIDTFGYEHSSGTVLSGVLADLDSAISSAAAAGVTVDPNTIIGDGTVQSPYTVTLESVLSGGNTANADLTVRDLNVTGTLNVQGLSVTQIGGATLDDIVALTIALG